MKSRGLYGFGAFYALFWFRHSGTARQGLQTSWAQHCVHTYARLASPSLSLSLSSELRVSRGVGFRVLGYEPKVYAHQHS